MSTIQGNILMTLIAAIPPMMATMGYLRNWDIVAYSSLGLKTVWTTIYLFFFYQAVWKYFTSPLRSLPTPPNPHFLFGHGLIMLDRPPGSTPLKWMKEIPNDGIINFPGLFHLRSNLILTNPRTVMEVLNAHSYDWEKPAPARKFLRRVLGDGLINVEGNNHKNQRRNVTPAFSGKNVKDLVPLFWTKSFSLAEAVQRELAVDNGCIDISPLCSRVTLDIIGSAGIGKDFSTTENAEHELAVQYSRIMDPNKGNIALYFIVNMIFPQFILRKMPVKANARVANAVFTLRKLVAELLMEKGQSVKKENVEQKDIIAILMRSGKFTNAGLTDQLLTFLAAGHETTASALTWATYLLAKYPDVQARLRVECQKAFGEIGPTRDMTAETIDSVPFLEAVCNETLRIYPTVPVTARCAVRQTRIGDYVIPKGSVAVVCAWALNRLPSLWGPDAEEFRPDRWMGPEGKNGGATSPYAFVTFLHGPRSCIGQSFARYELKCLLAVLVLRFSFKMKDPGYVPVPDGTVTIRPKDGIQLVMTPL